MEIVSTQFSFEDECCSYGAHHLFLNHLEFLRKLRQKVFSQDTDSPLHTPPNLALGRRKHQLTT